MENEFKQIIKELNSHLEEFSMSSSYHKMLIVVIVLVACFWNRRVGRILQSIPYLYTSQTNISDKQLSNLCSKSSRDRTPISPRNSTVVPLGQEILHYFELGTPSVNCPAIDSNPTHGTRIHPYLLPYDTFQELQDCYLFLPYASLPQGEYALFFLSFSIEFSIQIPYPLCLSSQSRSYVQN